MTTPVVEAVPGTGPGDAQSARFRAVLIAAGVTFLVLTLTQLCFALFVTPIFADMYAHNDIAVHEPQGTIFALTHHGVLAIVLAVFDAALFGGMYLLARRHGRWLLFVPAGVLFLMSLTYLPLMYLPIFDSMTVVK